MSGQHWAVCQAISSRVSRVQPEIEKTNHGTFLPTYTRVWSSDGKLSARERPLLPGYLFFLTHRDSWGAVRHVDGVYRVLSNCGTVSAVTDAEMHRMMIGHATGEFNEVDVAGLESSRRKRRNRKPRPSKRARARATA